MLLEAAWKAVHLTLILYRIFLQQNIKHLTLMDLKIKTLISKIGGLCETKRVLNHKLIPIYNLYC